MKPKLCKECKHCIPERMIGTLFVSHFIPAYCRRTDLITGDGTHSIQCQVERATESGFSCGYEAINFEQKP